MGGPKLRNIIFHELLDPIRHLRRSCYVNGRSCTLLRADKQERNPFHQQWKECRKTAHVVPETGHIRPWTQAVRRDACAFEAPGQLVGEKDIPQLRTKIGAQRIIMPLTLKIVEVYGVAMRFLSHRDDASSGCCAHEIKQEIGQQEGGQVIDCQRLFDTVGGRGTARCRGRHR
jgi:hypothetical protein